MKLKKYLLLLVILLVASLNFNLILKELNLVTGGTQGLSIILNYFFKVKHSIIILIINLLMLIISFFTLEKETTCGTIVSTLIYPLFINLTGNIKLPFEINNLIILIILSGIICGITSGIIYKLGFSSGGINIISLVMKKYLNINIALTNFFINSIIIILGMFSFGLKKCLYSNFVVLINSFIINKLLKKTNNMI